MATDANLQMKRLVQSPLLLALAFSAVVIGWPYLFPQSSIQDLARDCTGKCRKFNMLGNLEKEAAPYTPKYSPSQYSCRCV